MKVLQLLPRLNSGGVERGTVEVASFLISQGHEAVVVSFGGWREEALRRIGAKHIRLPVHSKNPAVMISLIPKLARIIEEEKVDVVHARSRVPAWIGYHAVRVVNRGRFKAERYPKIVNFVTTCHGRYSKGPISWVMGMGRKVIVPSMFIGEYMHRTFGVPEDRIVLIPRGVDLTEFEYHKMDRNSRIFLVLGRVTPNKGQDVVLKAFSRVVRRYPDIELWIVGDVGNNRYYEYLRSLQIRFSLQDSVKFLGPRKDVADILAKAYAVLVPSQYPESFGRVVLEAGAVGRPVLVSDIPALNELVDGKNGLLVRPDSVQDWQEKMIYLLDRPEKAEEMGRQGREKAEEFGVERMCERVLEVYESVLGMYRIGVIKTSALGDVALARYSFDSVKRNFPNSEVIAVGPEATRSLWQADKGVRLWDLALRKKRLDLDIVYDLQGKKVTQFLAWLSGAHRRFGYARKIGWFFHTDPIKYERDYPIREQERFLKECGLEPIPVEDYRVDVEEGKKREILLRVHGNTFGSIRKDRLIGLVLRSNWPTKSLPKEDIVNLITRSERCDRDLWVLIGPERDRAFAEEIIEEVRGKRPDVSVADMTGRTTLEDLFALISILDLLITPDSAPLHFAYLLRTPTLVYFGPTLPERHLPDDPEMTDFIRPIWTQACYPCYKKVCPNHPQQCLVGVRDSLYRVLSIHRS